jgi:O-antigen ligase/tetratricopeptide (TPR) repeat protein
MKDSFAKLSYQIILLLTVTSAIVAPLFFMPTTSEFFEFNKFTALLLITVTGTIVWGVRMVLDKRFSFTRTPLDIPIIILITVYFAASLSSVDQFVSLVGSQGRIWPSFFTFTTIAVFYFVLTSNLRTKKHVNTILWTLVGATAIAAVIATASYFGLFFPIEAAQNRGFNTLGIINRLALLEAFVLPLSVSWALFAKQKSTRVSALVTSLILLSSLILINFIPAYIAGIVGILALSVGNLKSKLDKNARSYIGIMALFTVFVLVLRFVPQVSSGTLLVWITEKNTALSEQQQLDTPKEVTVGRRVSWDVAAQTIGKRPLLGTGPSTYKFAYTQLKPRYINATDTWLVRFEKASSDFTEIITTLGIIGTLAYLFFLVTIARYLWALIYKSQNNATYTPLIASTIAFVAASLTATTSLSLIIPFFVVLALISTLAKSAGENHVYDITVEMAALKDKLAWFPLGSSEDLIKTTEGKGAKSQVLPSIFLIFVLIVSFVALRYQLEAYQGEYYYRQALLATQENDGNKTVANLQNAIQANPRVDTYHRALSETSINAAVNLSTQEDLTADQQQLLAQLAQVAIDQGKVASGYQILPLRLPGISAINVANWEVLATVYQAMIGSVTGAETHAVNTLTQAVSLDPQNPILHDRLGQLHQRIDNLDLAQRKFEDAIIVKGDYGPAHYHLAKVLIEKNGDVGRIVSELSLAQRFLPENDPALEQIASDLETYSSQLQNIQQTQQQQSEPETVQEPILPSPSPSPVVSPSPGASPSPSPEVSPSPSPSPSPSI